MSHTDGQSTKRPDRPRTVMMYAYYFPPCVCRPTAAARAAGFARYLSEYGWEPIVITRDLLASPCKCQIRRPDPEGSSSQRADVEDAELFPIAVEASRLMRARDRLVLNQTSRIGRPFRALLRRAASATLVASERYDTWVREGIRAGERLMTQRSVDAVWTTSGPYRSISIGRHFANRRRVPWIADLRDSISRLNASKTKRAVLEYLRRRSFAFRLQGAARLVEVTPQERLRDLDWLPNPVEVIPSGFEPSDWAPIHRNSASSSPRSKARFVIVYAGNIYTQDPRLFFRGLSQFVDGVGRRLDIQVDYYGPSGANFLAAARAASAHEFVHDHGVVTAETARTAMVEADVLLLLAHQGMSGVPGGKLYDYLASTSPILVVPAGDEYVEGVLASCSGGLSATTPAEICEALEEFAISPSPDNTTDFAVRVAQHGWSSRAKKLGEMLDEVVSSSETL